ncbi:Hypothetical predicted protein [Scomber scombrus]|uniref:Uncharacterized protein n=1 Tax=Scomber scombrus TaxID=13677 RepID=A0AAV1PWE1_SCOSC
MFNKKRKLNFHFLRYSFYFDSAERKSPVLSLLRAPAMFWERTRLVRLPDCSRLSSLELTSHTGFATMSNIHKQRELMASPRHNEKHRRVLLLIL